MTPNAARPAVIVAAVLALVPATFQASDVVAAVGQKTIRAADVEDELMARRKQDLARNRLDAFTSAGRDQALQAVVDRRLFALAAREHGRDRDPDVSRRLENVVDQLLADEEIAALTANLPTDTAALRAYYDAHADEFRGPEQRRARHIVVKTRDEAEAILSQLKAGADFSELARTHNVDSTKPTGGDLGVVRKGVMVAPFDAALFATPVGATSGVVRTSFGFHVIRVDAVVEGELPAFDAIREVVRQRVVDRRVAEARAQLERRFPVRIDTGALAKVDK